MLTRQWLLFPLCTAIISTLSGCGSSGSSGQVPPPQAVSIAFTPVPPNPLPVFVGTPASLIATVTNDPNNYGVDWSLTCQSGPNTCGTLNPPHTASGSAVTYVPPSSLNGNNLTGITIIALATADHTKNVLTSVAVKAFGNNLKGTYVLQVQGVDPYLNPYQFVGALVFDGDGNITSGEQTQNTGLIATTDQGLTGTYFLGNDGRGTITINDPNPAIGVETFAFVFLSNTDNPQALVAQADFGAAVTGTSAVGTLDLQTSITAPAAGYSFTVNGTYIVKSEPVAFGGVFNIDSPNRISGNGSVADEILAKKVNATAAPLSGTITQPDSFGSITLNLNAGVGIEGKPVPIQLTGYIVDDSHIALIESDNSATTVGFGSLGGIAIGQGVATGTFKDDTSLSGTYVFGVPGVDLSPNNSGFLPTTLTAAGLFTADGTGNLSNGFTDTFLQQNCAQLTCTKGGVIGAQISAAFSGTYAVDASGTGRVGVTLANFNPDPKHGYQPVIFFYLTGTGTPALVLQAGDSHYPLIGTGIAYLQSSAEAAVSGDYGFSFTQENGTENDGTAESNANASNTPQVSGIADANLGGGFSPDNGFLGSFSTPTSNVPFAGTLYADPNALNQNVFPLAPAPPLAVNYYYIDSAHAFFVETDLVNAASSQVSLGYYVARTPVCEGCP